MKQISLFIAALCCAVTINAENGALPGVFTINAQGDQVQFAHGNLFTNYWASDNTHKFSIHGNQYDIYGAASNIAGSSGVTTDLPGWGTGDAPEKWRMNAGYTMWTDWGVNPIEISRQGEPETYSEGWRTLTADEWMYLFTEHRDIYTDPQDLFGLGTVEGVPGIILIPDNGALHFHSLFTPYGNSRNFTANELTAAQWTSWEEAGAVFLPAAGLRCEDTYFPYDFSSMVTYAGFERNSVFYWTATAGTSSGSAKCLYFKNGDNIGLRETGSFLGLPVRLVRDVVNTEGIEDVRGNDVQCTKVVKDGQILILRGSHTYTLTSQVIK